MNARPDFATRVFLCVCVCVSTQSVVGVWQLVEDLRVLMKNLSLYSPHFLQIMISLLERYRDSCNHMYRGTYDCVHDPVR